MTARRHYGAMSIWLAPTMFATAVATGALALHPGGAPTQTSVALTVFWLVFGAVAAMGHVLGMLLGTAALFLPKDRPLLGLAGIAFNTLAIGIILHFGLIRLSSIGWHLLF